MKMMNGVISWNVLLLALHHLFHFIACVSFLSIFFFFSLVFLCVLLLAEVLREVWRYLNSEVVPRFLNGVSRGELLQVHLVINVTDLVEPTEPGSVWEKF